MFTARKQEFICLHSETRVWLAQRSQKERAEGKNKQSQNQGLSSPETRFYKTSNECCTLFFWISSMVLFMRTLKRKPMSAYVFICKEAYCVIVKRLQRKQKLSHANYAKWARFVRKRKEKWKNTQSGRKNIQMLFPSFPVKCSKCSTVMVIDLHPQTNCKISQRLFQLIIFLIQVKKRSNFVIRISIKLQWITSDLCHHSKNFTSNTSSYS